MQIKFIYDLISPTGRKSSPMSIQIMIFRKIAIRVSHAIIIRYSF